MTHRRRDMWRWPLSHWPNDPKTATVRRTLARRARKVEARAVALEIDRELHPDPHEGLDIWHDADVIVLEELHYAWLDWKEAHDGREAARDDPGGSSHRFRARGSDQGTVHRDYFVDDDGWVHHGHGRTWGD